MVTETTSDERKPEKIADGSNTTETTEHLDVKTLMEPAPLPSVEDKGNKSDGSDDPYAYLDWKDGIATLPGIS